MKQYRSYQEMIRDRLAKTGHIGKYDPRHIEAFMRLQYGTLDHLGSHTFNKEVELCRNCVDVGGTQNAENCALSYGL